MRLKMPMGMSSVTARNVAANAPGNTWCAERLTRACTRRSPPHVMPRIGPFELPNPFILAPMAGVSEKPFRVMALQFGAALAPTELISAKGLEYQNRRTRQYLDHSPVENPFCVQLFGG